MAYFYVSRGVHVEKDKIWLIVFFSCVHRITAENEKRPLLIRTIFLNILCLDPLGSLKNFYEGKAVVSMS